ncbi:MAG: glycosyltransferase family 87 protein, partial [Solirubrobacteraceae bacterium]
MEEERSARARLRFLASGLGRYLLLPALLIAGPLLASMAVGVDTHNLLYDFKGGLYNAGVAILHGNSPYRGVFLAHQAAIMRAGHIALGETTRHPFSVPVYPAAANVAILPLSALPLWPAASIYTLGSIAAMLGGIWLLGVRDWRCFALVSLSWPFLYGMYLGAINPFLVLGAGVAWRWRDRLWPPALGLATIIALKIFPWTLGAWLLFTRRWRALALTVVACGVVTFGAWAAIGFHGLAQYPQMLSNVSYLQEGRADSVVTALVVAGVGPSFASVVAIVLALGVLGLAWRAARRPDGDRRAFGLVVIAALTGTPIVWEHYMVLVFIPIAMLSPRVSRLWLVPVVLPIVELMSRIVLPDSSRLQAYSPNALRGALPWLCVEVALTTLLCTTVEQRAAVRA